MQHIHHSSLYLFTFLFRKMPLHRLVFILCHHLFIHSLGHLWTYRAMRIQGVKHKPHIRHYAYDVAHKLRHRMVDYETGVHQGTNRQRQPLYALCELQREIALIRILILLYPTDNPMNPISKMHQKEDIRHTHHRHHTKHHNLKRVAEFYHAHHRQQQHQPAYHHRQHKHQHPLWTEQIKEEIAFHHHVGERREKHHRRAVHVKQRRGVAYIKKVWYLVKMQQIKRRHHLMRRKQLLKLLLKRRRHIITFQQPNHTD